MLIGIVGTTLLGGNYLHAGTFFVIKACFACTNIYNLCMDMVNGR